MPGGDRPLGQRVTLIEPGALAYALVRLGESFLYADVLAAPGAMRAALSYYRTAFSPEGLAQSRDRAERKLTMPVLAFGAERGVGEGLIDTLPSDRHRGPGLA